MPHIVIEHCNSLNQEVQQSKLSAVLHKTVVDSGLFSPEAVKARSISYDDVVLPEGALNFTHITVSILTGRSVEERQTLSQSVFQAAQTALPQADKLSVDIHVMEKDTYRK